MYRNNTSKNKEELLIILCVSQETLYLRKYLEE